MRDALSDEVSTWPGLKLEAHGHLVVCQAYGNAEARCTN